MEFSKRFSFWVFTSGCLMFLSAELSAQQRFWINSPAFVEEAAEQFKIAQGHLHPYLNQIAYEQLALRKKYIQNISSREEAVQRQRTSKATIIDLVGGVPLAKGPVRVKRYASFEEEKFSVENIAYESAPDYWVTANVYVPHGDGPFPALVIAPGHGGAGKTWMFSWGANFASSGFVVLSIDPLGQGERLIHFDEELGRSKVEPSGEHEHANQTALLVGQHISRYWMADGIRGLDYLVQRKDVNSSKIATFGCSGGGTAAAYLAAMDERVKAAVVASYITSYTGLMPGNGPQDAEQTIPSFIAEGFDFADWLELAAPRSMAVVAFEEDFFPLAGARESYEESSNFYAHFSAREKLQLIVGEGGHCNLGPVTDQIRKFLHKALSLKEPEENVFKPTRPSDPDKLLVMPSGQVSTTLKSESAESIARSLFKVTKPKNSVQKNDEEFKRWKAKLQNDIKNVARINLNKKRKIESTQGTTEEFKTYTKESYWLHVEDGIRLEVIMLTPRIENVGNLPSRIYMDSLSNKRSAESADVAHLLNAGIRVVVFQPRGVLGEPDANSEKIALGQYMQEFLRAAIIKKTITGMRTEDIIALLDWLVESKKIDEEKISLYAFGALGISALHAAALDDRISHVITESTLVSYEEALNAALHRNLSEVLIPNILSYYDTDDLVKAIYPRRVSIVNPSDAMGNRIRNVHAKKIMSQAIAQDEVLGTASRIQFSQRGYLQVLMVEGE